MFFEDAIGWLIAALAALCVAIIAWVLWSAWQDSQRPTIELKRDDWTCSKKEARTQLQPMLVGKVTVLMPMTTTVCVEYKRHAG